MRRDPVTAEHESGSPRTEAPNDGRAVADEQAAFEPLLPGERVPDDDARPDPLGRPGGAARALRIRGRGARTTTSFAATAARVFSRGRSPASGAWLQAAQTAVAVGRTVTTNRPSVPVVVICSGSLGGSATDSPNRSTKTISPCRRLGAALDAALDRERPAVHGRVPLERDRKPRGAAADLAHLAASGPAAVSTVATVSAAAAAGGLSGSSRPAPV